MPSSTKIQGKGSHPNSRKNLEKGAWRPGQSGNPAGKPPGARDRSTIIRKWADVKIDVVNPITKDKEKGTVEDEVALSLIREARKGNVPAIKEFLDTLYGKMTERHDLNVNVSELTDEQLDAILSAKT